MSWHERNDRNGDFRTPDVKKSDLVDLLMGYVIENREAPWEMGFPYR